MRFQGIDNVPRHLLNHSHHIALTERTSSASVLENHQGQPLQMYTDADVAPEYLAKQTFRIALYMLYIHTPQIEEVYKYLVIIG